MASYVFVWENNTVGHRAVSGRAWSGHSSVNIGNMFQIESRRGNNNYVSWWPQTETSFSVAGMVKSAFSRKQRGQREAYFVTDVATETYLPDHVIRLDTSARQEADMIAAWRAIYMKPGGSYRNYRKNCSTIVSRILHAGGLHAQKWAVDSNWVWSPADIRKLAIGAGGHYMQWRHFLPILAESGILPGDLAVGYARSGRLCSTGATCKFQPNETFKG